MPTTITKTIKPAGGGDYTSLNAAELALRANLVTADQLLVLECYSGGNLLTSELKFDGANWTTDSTRYIQIVAASGHEHAGIYDTTKAYGEATVSVGSAVIWASQTAFLRVEKLQLRKTDTNTGSRWVFYGDAPGDTARYLLNRCILINEGNNEAVVRFNKGGITNGVNVVKNCILLNRGIGDAFQGQGTFAQNSSNQIYNSILIGGITQNSGTTVSRNNYLTPGTGSGTCYSGAGTITKGTYDATSNTEALTVGLQSVAHSTANFISVTSGSENYHIKGASILKDAGEDLSGLPNIRAVTEDFEGNSRPVGVAFDIGADEYSTIAPVANFTADATTGVAPFTVNFTDTSINEPTSWSWNFSDSPTSALQNPSHTFNSVGTYTVTLTATNGGGSDGETKTNYITVNPPTPVADFTADITSGTNPLVVNFTDTSTNSPTSWSWNFSDSPTSSVQNPTHTFNTPGLYTITLTATNITGSDGEVKTSYIEVNPPPPVSDFSALPLSGTTPLLVNFTDLSTNTPTSWNWDFGDPLSGINNSSVLQNPAHTYDAAGTYSVSLTTSNAGGSDNETKTSYITVTTPPGAVDFTASANSGIAPLDIVFTDLSANSPTSWLWDFGDPSSGADNVSTSQNPEHIYETPGIYTISLTATGMDGPKTKIRTDFVVVITPPPIADFLATPVVGFIPLIVSFTDGSTGNPTSFSWNFGDGNISIEQNPTHTYIEVGTFSVTLTVINDSGSDTKTISIEVLPVPDLVADFTTGSMTAGSVVVQFFDQSSAAVSFLWDFGDPSSGVNNTSILQNPIHSYSSSGMYQVNLTVVHGPFTDTICKNILVTTETTRYQEIWGTVEFADGTPVEANRVVQVSKIIGATEFECGGDATDSAFVYRTIDDAGITRFLTRARGNIIGISDSGFIDGEPVYIYVGGRLATDLSGIPISVPFFQTLPSNPNSHIELDLVFPLPTATISPPGGVYGDRVTITMLSNVMPSIIWYTVDGSDPKISGTRILFVDPFVLLEGTTTIKFYTEDPLGSDEATRQETYIIQEPLVTANPPSADYSSPQGIVLNKNRAGTIYYRLNYSGGYEKFLGIPIEIVAGPSGIQTTVIQAYLIDSRGKVGPISVFTYKIDLINPVITNFTLNNGDLTTGSQIITVQVEASSYTNTVTGLLLSTFSDFSDASVRLYQPEVTFLLPIPDGIKTVYARVLDQFDPPHFSVIKTANITLDTEIPTFTLSNGPTESIGETSFTFSGTKSSNSGILLKVNGGSEKLIIPFDTTTTWEYTVDLQEGNNVLDFQAATFVNNRSAVQSRTISVILIPSGVTFATTITKPDGTWKVPFVFFNESLVVPHWNKHDFRIIVSTDIGPDPIVLSPNMNEVLFKSISTISGTATPGSRITLKVEPKVTL